MIHLGQIITVSELLNQYSVDVHIFEALPEFNFLESLAQGIKRSGCLCGKYQELQNCQTTFNKVAQSLSEESVTKMKALLNRERLCFGIQESAKFEAKCY